MRTTSSEKNLELCPKYFFTQLPVYPNEVASFFRVPASRVPVCYELVQQRIVYIGRQPINFAGRT